MSLAPEQTITADVIDGLRRAIVGRVITPVDADYDAIRALMPGGLDPRPAVIVRVANADDVAHVVRVARDRGIPLAVRCGGHGAAGHASVDGGLVIDIRDLTDLDVDVEGRTAWAGAGLTAAAVTTTLAEHGLAIGFGDTGSVGIGGLTTGGGVGYLVRKFGLTIDSLLAVELVTADGAIRQVDARSDPDLFWAIRGGGGNLGVVTRFRYQLQHLPEVYGGMLILPATPEAVAGFVAANQAAPDELSAIGNVMPLPPMPFVPEEHHGELVIFSMIVYAGDAAAGEAAVAPFRALGTPLADMVQVMPYPQIYPPDDPDYHPLAESKNLFTDRFGLDEATVAVDALKASDAPLRVVQIRVLGGAYARVPSDATAYAHRDRPIMLNVASFYEGEDRATRQQWVDDLAAALEQGEPAAYVNFVGDEGDEGIRRAYPEATRARLAAIKARVDPTNLFRHNQNVPPATA